ncbi:MAG: SH3 domain-containing protein [Marinibacterium sp.]
MTKSVAGRHLAVSVLLGMALVLAGPPGQASEKVAGKATIGTQDTQQPVRGPVTNLPLPRFVSMKAPEGNVRRGPSRTHRIDWVFKRRDMPLRITAEHGHWRRVEDRDGAGGWVHYALLSGNRTVLVEKDMAQAHTRPDPSAPVSAMFELGVVARLGDCTIEWCRISAGGYRGWVPKSYVWGVGPNEIRD